MVRVLARCVLASSHGGRAGEDRFEPHAQRLVDRSERFDRERHQDAARGCRRSGERRAGRLRGPGRGQRGAWLVGCGARAGERALRGRPARCGRLHRDARHRRRAVLDPDHQCGRPAVDDLAVQHVSGPDEAVRAGRARQALPDRPSQLSAHRAQRPPPGRVRRAVGGRARNAPRLRPARHRALRSRGRAAVRRRMPATRRRARRNHRSGSSPSAASTRRWPRRSPAAAPTSSSTAASSRTAPVRCGATSGPWRRRSR